jgi:hypothetical protein
MEMERHFGGKQMRILFDICIDCIIGRFSRVYISREHLFKSRLRLHPKVEPIQIARFVRINKACITRSYFTRYSPASSLAAFKLALPNYKSQ